MKKSQNEEVHAMLLDRPISGITQWDAQRELGCMRLASRINDLRKRGIKIKTRMVYRKGARYAEYYLTEILENGTTS